MLAPVGGPNRIAGVAVPLAVGAVALGANALIGRRSVWLSTLLYSAAVLAIFYGMIVALSVPLRLAVGLVCQPPPADCPLGFDRPLTPAESFGVYAVAISGALSVLLSVIAAEVQHRRRLKPPANIGSGPPTHRPRPSETSS